MSEPRKPVRSERGWWRAVSQAFDVAPDASSRFSAFFRRRHQRDAYPSLAGVAACALAGEIAPREHRDVLAPEQAAGEILVVPRCAWPEVERRGGALQVQDGCKDIHGCLK